MKIIIILPAIIMFDLFLGNIYAQIYPKTISGSGTVFLGAQTVLKEYRKPPNYKPYECELFKIDDRVTYSRYWIGNGGHFDGIGIVDFVGVVTKIEPKQTNEYIHWITVEKISGTGEGGIYSEQFLVNKLN